MDQIRRVATGAIYEAGRTLKGYFGRIDRIDKKGATDLVTAADIAAEKKIVAAIKKAFPDHSILAEESGMVPGQDDYQWVIDPLDGTTNFAHGLPFYSVSIAFTLEQETVVGLVLNPDNGELFTAIKGQGAALNGTPIQVSKIHHLIDALVITGFPYDTDGIFVEMIAGFTACLKATQGIRRLGSAALDLCYVACGRCDAFWEQRLSPWDTAAGALIVAEADGHVTDFQGKPYKPHQKEILATNASIHQELLNLLVPEQRNEK